MIQLIFALAVAAQATGEPRTINHAKCINVAAKRFEASGERSADVATAVEKICRGLEPQPDKKNIIGQLTEKDRQSSLAIVRDAIRDSVTVFIVEYRACKNTKGCDLRSVDIVTPSRALEFMASDSPVN